jgi:hypothetical protein
MGQPRPDFLPDRPVQPSGPYLGMLTHPLAATAVGLRAQAAGRGVRARLALAGPGAEALPIVGLATVLAWQQAVEHRQRPATRLPGRASLRPPLRLDRRHHRRCHQRGHRDGVPRLRGDVHGRHGPPRLPRPSPLRPQARSQRVWAGLAQGRRAHRGRRLAQPPDHPALPDPLARAGHRARPGAPATDRANRQAVAAAPVKPLADQSGCVWHEVRARLSTPLVLRDVAVARGRPAAPMDRASPRRMPLAPAVACHELGALIRGAPPLALQEQGVCRTLAQRPVEKDDRPPRTPDLLPQHHVRGVCARHPIGGVPLHAVHSASRDALAPALEGWPHQGRPALAFVKPWPRLGAPQALGRDALA